MDNRIERIVLETAGQRIVGDLTMPREGYRSRLSDYLNRGDLDFIPLANVEISALDGSSVLEREFVAVARGHIRFAYPLDGIDPEDLEPQS
jgi:hypothetical protein